MKNWREVKENEFQRNIWTSNGTERERGKKVIKVIRTKENIIRNAVEKKM